MVGKDIENMFFIAMKMLTRCRCKVIISQHNYFYQKNKDRKSLREGFIYLLMKLLYRHSDFIICVAKGIEQYVMTLNVEKNKN